MKVEQLICPACGASLKINKGTNLVKCEYCKNTYVFEDPESEREKERLRMEKEHAQAMLNSYQNDKIKLERNVKNSRFKLAAILITSFIIIGVIIIMTVTLGAALAVKMNKGEKTSSRTSRSVPVIIKDIDDVPKVTMDKINNDALKAANDHYTALYGGWYIDSISLEGDYLVSYDNEPESIIFTVIKSVYKNRDSGEVHEVYSAFSTNDLCKKEDGTTVQSNSTHKTYYCKSENPSFFMDPDSIVKSYIFGWEDPKELYKDCILYIEKDYHISYAGDVYIPESAKSIAGKADYVPSTGDIDEN